MSADPSQSTTLVGVLSLAVAALAIVVTYLFKYYSKRFANANEALLKAHAQCAAERADFASERKAWAIERTQLECKLDELEGHIRSEYDAKLLRALEAHATQIDRIYSEARGNADAARREYIANMDQVNAKASESVAKLGIVMEKMYDRFVSAPRKGPRS